MRHIILIIFFLLLLIPNLSAQELQCLKMPNQELLSSNKVLFLIEDSEGCLWYATEGGGVCRDDGRHVDVFRSDAETPDLLGSNNVACLAEAGRHIVIGTFHGAYVLDKKDFSIKRMAEVDDKRVDDIIVLRNGDVLLTSNMKVYRFGPTLTLKATYSSPEKYVARLFEDASGCIWATQWQGGLLCLKGEKLVEVPWEFDAQPTDLADGVKGTLWVGTMGRGVVCYHPDNGNIDIQPQAAQGIVTDVIFLKDDNRLWVSTLNGLQAYETGNQLTPFPLDNILPVGTSLSGRLSLDTHGRLLVASHEGVSAAIGRVKRWDVKEIMTTESADSMRQVCQLSTRPTAMTFSRDSTLWFSTGKDIRKKVQSSETEEVVLSDTKDVSAMTFSADGTLWLGTIFGKLYHYKDGLLMVDEYATNEYGDGVIAMSTDSMGRLVIVYDRYVRLYDMARQTLRQQSREADGVYCIELQETAPGASWNHPKRDMVVERMARWLTSWWMWCVYLLFFIGIGVLVIHNIILRRQRDKFLEMLKAETKKVAEEPSEGSSQQQPEIDPILQKAITFVEKNLDKEQYTVEELSQDMCMSRMTFYRKIQSLTGQKPTEFIRTIRLRRAADLLSQGSLTVTEVSYATGFSSVSYFSRCFRTMYGVPPKLFGKTMTADDCSPNENLS